MQINRPQNPSSSVERHGRRKERKNPPRPSPKKNRPPRSTENTRPDFEKSSAMNARWRKRPSTAELVEDAGPPKDETGQSVRNNGSEGKDGQSPQPGQ